MSSPAPMGCKGIFSSLDLISVGAPMYVDVHTHLTHERFRQDQSEVIERARHAGLSSIIVNGLDPKSNRETLQLSNQHEIVLAALGIYPVNAVNDLLPEDFTLPVPRFDVDAEIEFIASMAEQKQIVAIGECGLDGYWVPESTFKKQESVFERLIDIALKQDIPLIVHTRKLEVRAIEVLRSLKAEKVIFHCFGGKVKLAQKCAESDGWWFSIPANARVNQSFSKMLKVLPLEKILTETDAPYLAPIRGNRNEPMNVRETVALLAEIRDLDGPEAAVQIWRNYCKLFKK